MYFLRKFLRRKNREINVYLREIFSSCVFYDFPYYLNTEQIHFDELFLLFPKEKNNLTGKNYCIGFLLALLVLCRIELLCPSLKIQMSVKTQ